MNPYNQQQYGYPPPQTSPGPPQPPWQAPPRRGWGDPRIPGQGPQSPVSPAAYPNAPSSNAFGPPLPPPPPPQSHYPSQQPQYDTSQWGVKYNQGLGGQAQHEEPKPALPPRPTTASGRLSPQPPQPDYPQQQPPWHDAYHPGNTIPPPPPPRPAEYQAQIQAAHHSRTSTPHNEYSHQPPSHHYDPRPPQQNAWNTQPPQATAPTYQPTAPPPQHLSGTLDGPLVSPIEPQSGYWGGSQGQQTTNQAQNNYNAPQQKQYGQPAYPQAQGFGGPSDWEYYDPNAPPPDQTPTTPPPNSLYQAQGPVSPPRKHATPAPTHQSPVPEPVQPNYAVEIGAPSPVSPRKGSHFPPQTNDHQPPIRPVIDERRSSAGQYPSNASIRSDSLNGAGNIDSVIQAWNTPLKPRPAPDSVSRPESRASAPRVASPEPEPSPSSVKLVDPYADLEPEFKASLKRYAGMLRKEAAASTDDEKFDIFQTFVTKELRLRSLLYGVELKKEAAREVKKAASVADIQAVLPKSALPDVGTSASVAQAREPVGTASEPAPAPVPAQPPPAQPSTTIPQARAQPEVARQEPPKLANSNPIAVVPPLAPQPTSRPPLEDRRKSKDDGYVMAAAPASEDAYSPGGRPLMTKVPAGGNDEAYSPGGRPIPSSATKSSPTRPALDIAAQEGSRQQPPAAFSPSNYAPMVIEDYLAVQPPSPSINAPIVVTQEPPAFQGSPRPTQNSNKPVVPIKFEPARPAYTPFRYNAGVQEEKTKSLRPADQAYSSLRHSQADSGRLLAQDAALLAPVRPSSTSGRKEHEEAFIGLIRKQSMAVRQKPAGAAPPLPRSMTPGAGINRPGSAKPEPPAFMRVGTPAAPPFKPHQPADIVKEAVTALRSLLPSLDDLPTPIDSSGSNPKLKIIRDKIDTVTDQFTFIHDAVVDWDRTNRLVRGEQEAERQERQRESEAHIDDLFNDNEIGYADIGELEAEFKLSEAEKKYQEDQAELESFTSQVFVVVTEKLQKEIAELTTAYTMAIDLLDLESVAVSRCFKEGGKKPVRMTEVMSCVLTLFNKIEIRHRKIAEAHVERERRRKHLELTVLYTNGDVQGVKQLEKEFASAEKMAVLHEARGKDTRANKLMDSFDRATVRGLGDNQVFTDDLLSKLQELKKPIDSLLSSPDAQSNMDILTAPSGARDTLHIAQSTLESITTDSRRLLALSSEGDILLNDADYNVSVAEARVANADQAVYAKLEEEKGKEDGKLIEEMNVRTVSVTKAPNEGVKLVKELSERVGGVEDPGKKERMQLALEAAKMRNAGNPAAVGDVG